MRLKTCLDCEFGVEKEEKSFCELESCYSKLTKCIQNKALDIFIKDQVVKVGKIENKEPNLNN